MCKVLACDACASVSFAVTLMTTFSEFPLALLIFYFCFPCPQMFREKLTFILFFITKVTANILLKEIKRYFSGFSLQ